jgi:RHS protein
LRGETPVGGTSTVAYRYFAYTPELRLPGETADDVPNLWSADLTIPMKHQIIWFGDRPAGQVPLTGGTLSTFTDHLGTPILQTDAAATHRLARRIRAVPPPLHHAPGRGRQQHRPPHRPAAALPRPGSGHDVGGTVSFHASRIYSPRNLLLEVTAASEPGEPLPHKLLYSYDGRGIRVVRGETPVDGTSTVAYRYFAYTPELRLLAETADDVPNLWSADLTIPMKHQIIWFGDRPAGQVPLAGNTLFTFTDHLGTPILQTDAAATVVWQAEYEPFGHLYTMRQDPAGNDIGRRTDQPLRFPGQEVAMTWEGRKITTCSGGTGVGGDGIRRRIRLGSRADQIYMPTHTVVRFATPIPEGSMLLR